MKLDCKVVNEEESSRRRIRTTPTKSTRFASTVSHVDPMTLYNNLNCPPQSGHFYAPDIEKKRPLRAAKEEENCRVRLH
jgi:hypothetical protein